MWLNSDWVSEICTPFSPVQNAQSALEAAGKESRVESLSFLFRWALPRTHKAECPVSAHPQGCPKYLVKFPGTWRWHTLGRAADFAPFRSKCSRIFFVLVIYTSLHLLICLLWQLHFLHKLQCYFVFPKALPLAFLSLFCLRSHFMTIAFLLGNW